VAGDFSAAPRGSSGAWPARRESVMLPLAILLTVVAAAELLLINLRLHCLS